MERLRVFVSIATLWLMACAGGGMHLNGNGGFDRNDLNPKIEPCDDFYSYANGGWQQRNPIPAAFPSWGSFHALAERNRDHLHEILNDVSSRRESLSGDSRKLGGFFTSCMNESKIDEIGIVPIEPELERIDRIRSTDELSRLVAELHRDGIPMLFAFFAEPDLEDNDLVVPTIMQGGLGLPERDYYFREDERSEEIRRRYVAHVAEMLELSGRSGEDANRAAARIMALETRLAEASMPVAEMRDPYAIHHRFTPAELSELTPRFDWATYASLNRIPRSDYAVVGQPEFLRALDREIAGTDLETWKDYLRWKLVQFAAPLLASDLDDASFEFSGRFLQGRSEQYPRWRRCVVAADDYLGDALGQLYVERHFSPEAKRQVVSMIEDMRAVLRDEIGELKWMGPDTRREAIAKLDAFGLKIGYPERWDRYEEVGIDEAQFARNVFRASADAFRREVDQIGKPVDPEEWGMTPPTVNAYHDPQQVEIVFPAGILQPPFFDPEADPAYNYGAIGGVIGHELIHGFDDTGRKFDRDGSLRDWWTEEDATEFERLAACVREQFDTYDLGTDYTMDGSLVLGESIADLGALKIGYLALQRSFANEPRRTVDGFTPEQRFFLGWARVWASNYKPEYERLLATTDEHPLPRSRVNGPLANMPQFAGAWGCSARDRMVRPEGMRCEIW